MKNTKRKKSKPSDMLKPVSTQKTAPSLTEGYESIRVPIPQPSSFNKDRPAGCLLQAQLRHFHHAESARLAKEKRDGRKPEDILTESEAADYIAKITKLLHPQRRRKSKPPVSK